MTPVCVNAGVPLKLASRLISMSYDAAPGTAVQLNCGSNTCELASRSVTVSVLAVGHDQTKW